jgi:hypothetical protein
VSALRPAWAVFAACALASCAQSDRGGAPGDDSGPNSGGPADGGAPVDSGSSASGSDAGQDAGEPGSDGGLDGGPSADAGEVADCNTYCAQMMSTCTGPNAQYYDLLRCQSACPLLLKGAASDTTGNTLACRMNHLALAAGAPNPECWHAGPFGYGGCGGACEDFCALTVQWCSPAQAYAGTQPYTGLIDCLAACDGYRQVDSASTGVGVDGGWWGWGPFAGNTLDCRETHLGNALDGPPGGLSQSFHCEHVQRTPPGGQCLQP